MTLMAPTRDDDSMMTPAQHPMHAVIAPLGPAPQPLSASDMMGMNPDIPAPMADSSPVVTRAMSPREQYEAKEGQRLMGDISKDQNPYGSAANHPGFMGKLLHGLNVATGGVNRRQFEEQNLGKELESIENENSRRGLEQAQTAETSERTREMPGKERSAEALQGAQTQEAESRAQDILNPHPQWEVYNSDEGPIIYNRNASGGATGQRLTVDGQPVGPKLNLKESKPIMGPDGKPHTYMVDDQGNKRIDLGVHYERPINVNSGDASVDRLATRLAKPYQTASDKSSAQLDNVDKTIRSINSGYKGQALGLPETLTSLVSGQGTGVRVTMPELQMIGQHNGIAGDVESFFNKISGQGSMTAEDKKQLSGILTEMRGILQDKIAINSGALDAINGGESRQDIQKADKIARHQLQEYERIGALPDRGKHFATLSDGTRIMSADEDHWQNIITGEEVK